MDSAHIDYLLQIPPVRPESANAPSRSRDDGPPFDRHFQQAGGADNSGSTASPHTASENNGARRQPTSENQRPAGTTPTQNRPADDVRDSEASSAPEEHTEETPADTVAVAATSSAVKPAQDSASSEAAATESSPTIDPSAESKAKHKPSKATAAKQGPNEKLPGSDESSATDGDSLSAADDVTVEVAKAVNASGEEVSSQTADIQLADQLATDESATPVVENAAKDAATVEQSTESRPTRKGRRDVAANSDSAEVAAKQAVVETSSEKSDKPIVEPSTNSTSAQSSNSTPAIDVQQEVTTDAPAARDELKAESELNSDEKLGAPASRPAAARTAAVPPTTPAAAPIAVATERGASQSADADSPTTTKKITSDAKESVLTTFARFERSAALGGRGVHRPGESQSAPHVDPARFIGRVARAIQTAQDRGAPLLLRLSPPELGSLRLELSVQQGVLSATVEADNQNARQLLLDNLPALRDRLADQNIRIERFDVDVRRDGEGREQPTFNPQQQQEQHHHRTTHRPGMMHGPTSEDALDAAPVIPQAITNTSINVVA